ncbi:helix-turn-helix transcriptional regulator [Paracidovorax sp. MALMAid1276]|uniref:helix-turn-helix transcriptional regulator n=1 Tax=Paracidovorax sp. MALMAid1276 TaxID=3411631 RepID=UPI003B9A4190
MLTIHSPNDIGMPGLIRSIYDAALDASRWQEFLVRFAAEFSSQTTMIFGQDFSDGSVEVTGGSTSLAAHHGVDEASMASFAAHYCRTNVWTADERLHHEGCIVNGSKFYPDEHLPRTEWHCDWLRPLDLFYTLAAVVEKRTHRSFNVTAVRSKRSGPYTAEEEQRLQLLVPHLQTAFALHRRLHKAEALAHASVAVLESLPMGVVLLGEAGCLLHANARAHSLAQSSGLVSISDSDGLRAKNAADNQRLQGAMRAVVSNPASAPMHAGTGMRLRGMTGNELHVVVTPLPHWSEPFGAHACGAVFISDPATPLQSLEGVLRSLYGLTPAEARLAQALVNGLSLQDHAEQQSVSIHTVRSQFRTIANKVGVGRQTDLVRTVLTGPAMLRRASAPQAMS